MTHSSTGLLPLVIALHGRLGDGAAQDKLSHFSKIAAREKFLLALPDGYSRSWADSRGITPAAAAGYDDVQFISDLIQWFVTNHRADPARVYLTGMSNGGFMTVTATCKLADKIAAFAIVGAEVAAGLECKPSSPVSGMIIMGDEDPLVPFHGGKMEGRGSALSAAQSIDFWGKLDGCITYATTPLPDTDPDDGTHSTVGRWTGCKNGVELELVSVIGGGHTWPGGWQYLNKFIIGRTAQDFDASERIWAFFSGKKK
jgi:polyhydroxybutyrate depolymerase